MFYVDMFGFTTGFGRMLRQQNVLLTLSKRIEKQLSKIQQCVLLTYRSAKTQPAIPVLIAVL